MGSVWLRRVGWLAAAAAAVLALAWLHDPPWLAGYTSGLGRWETAPDGTAVRWAAPHASFFVPADAGGVRFRLRAGFLPPPDRPLTVSIAVDDVPVERMTLADQTWREAAFRLPRPGSRRVRRIDVRSDFSAPDGLAIQIGSPVPIPAR